MNHLQKTLIKMMKCISKIPTMENFLFFLDLRRGAMIAAIFGIVMCSIDAPNFVVYLKYFQNRHEHHFYESKTYVWLLFFMTLTVKNNSRWSHDGIWLCRVRNHFIWNRSVISRFAHRCIYRKKYQLLTKIILNMTFVTHRKTQN